MAAASQVLAEGLCSRPRGEAGVPWPGPARRRVTSLPEHRSPHSASQRRTVDDDVLAFTWRHGPTGILFISRR